MKSTVKEKITCVRFQLLYTDRKVHQLQFHWKFRNISFFLDFNCLSKNKNTEANIVNFNTAHNRIKTTVHTLPVSRSI